MTDHLHEIKKNPYPGRGIIIGKTPDGKKAMISYFIMGRSENSRNRIFVMEENNLRTKAFDEKKMQDPSLVIYHPVLVLDEQTIVTNGDQSDTIYHFLTQERTFEEALNTRTFEPDAPIFTPRISGLASVEHNELTYKLSILKTLNGQEETTVRHFFNYSGTPAGVGHFIHTYDAYTAEYRNALPSFTGEPKTVSILDDVNEYVALLWESLDADNKVSLFARTINLETRQTESVIINKNT